VRPVHARSLAAVHGVGLYNFKYSPVNYVCMKPKSIAGTREWKKLDAAIKKANKDPEFRKSIERFIRISSNHE